MATYDELNKENKSIYRYTLTFKTSWELHTAVQEVASQKGNNISDTCRDLLAIGIENYNKEPGQFERHRLRLYRDIRKVMLKTVRF